MTVVVVAAVLIGAALLSFILALLFGDCGARPVPPASLPGPRPRPMPTESWRPGSIQYLEPGEEVHGARPRPPKPGLE